MEELEKIIKGNIDSFNSEEPESGHFERFQKKLKKSGKKEKLTISYFLKVAVVVLFVSVSSILTYEMVIREGSSNRSIAEITRNEYQEVDFYYTSQINAKYNEIKSLDLKDSLQKEMLLQELANADSLYLNLKQDIEENPNDERIISTMIEHYQMKLEVMNQIITNLKQIENINNKKETYYESTEI